MGEQPAEIEVEYSFNESLFMRGCHALWSYRAIGRSGNFTVASVVVICAGMLLWLGVPGPLAPLLLGGATVFVGMDMIRDLLWRRQFRRSRLAQEPMTVELTARGVTFGPVTDTVFMPWKSFQSFARTDEFLFIIINQRRFVIIPLAAFPNPQDATACEAVLIAHLRRLPRRVH